MEHSRTIDGAFSYQLVLRYGISFYAKDAKDIVHALESIYPSVTTDTIGAEGSNIIFSFDSDKQPVYAMLFVEKLTIGTELSDSADSLAVDFSESDLTAWRATYTPACAVIDKIQKHLVGLFPEKRITLGWRTHVCVWKVDESARVERAETKSKSLVRETPPASATAPRPKKTSHGRHYSVGSNNNTVRVVKK